MEHRRRTEKVLPLPGLLVFGQLYGTRSGHVASVKSANSIYFHQHRERPEITHLLSSTSPEAYELTFFLHLFSITSRDYPSFFPRVFRRDHNAVKLRLLISMTCIFWSVTGNSSNYVYYHQHRERALAFLKCPCPVLMARCYLEWSLFRLRSLRRRRRYGALLLARRVESRFSGFAGTRSARITALGNAQEP